MQYVQTGGRTDGRTGRRAEGSDGQSQGRGSKPEGSEGLREGGRTAFAAGDNKPSPLALCCGQKRNTTLRYKCIALHAELYGVRIQAYPVGKNCVFP